MPEPHEPGRPDVRRRGGGARALRPRRRRTHGLPGTLGMTVLGALVPGSGYLYAGRKALGGILLVAWVLLAAATVGYLSRDTRTVVDLAFDPTRLRLAAVALGVGLAVWAFVVFTSYRLVRPRRRPRWHTVAGNTAVLVLCLTMAAPVVVAARYAVVQADLVTTIFEDNESATAPTNVTEDDPWAGRPRVNVLLLGGDGSETRSGVRTDSVILLSMNTKTGKTLMFSLPRNLMNPQFPEGSPLHELYPDGYSGYEDDAFYMLNAVYGQLPERHPGVLGKSDNEGADAVKQAVSGSLGVPVDYYLMVDLEGFKDVVDAIGGVTVNINEPVAINGNDDLGIPPTGYLEPGPARELDGFEAMWFARGRYGSDDYERMERQRCMVDAIIDAADPGNLIRRYTALAATGKEIVSTDIPLELAPAFVDLALKVKEAKVKSVVFRNSDRFFSGEPDYDYLREVVARAIDPPPRDPDAPRRTRPASEKATDVCGYAPTDETVIASD